MTASRGKKKRDISPPSKALFTIVVNKKTTRVSDKELRSWTGRAEWAILELFTAARISGRFEFFHDTSGSRRLIHVEAKAGVRRALELFDEQASRQEVSVADAGERVVQQAKEELARYVKAVQHIALEELEGAARKVRQSPESLNRHLVEIVKGAEQHQMQVSTHGSDHLLTVYLPGGASVLDKKKITIVAQVEFVGKAEAWVAPAKISRAKHPWLRRSLRIQFAPDRADDESMNRLYGDAVRKGQLVVARGLRIRQKEGRGGSSLFVQQAVRFAGKTRLE